MASVILKLAGGWLAVLRYFRWTWGGLLSSLHSLFVWLADVSSPSGAVTAFEAQDDGDVSFLIDAFFLIFGGLLLGGAFLCGRWSASRCAVVREPQRAAPTKSAEVTPNRSSRPRAPALRAASPAVRTYVQLSPRERPRRSLRRVPADPPSPCPASVFPVPLRSAAPSADGGSGLL